MNNITANRIRSLREDRDMRQADVAAKTGIDQRSISNYETGKTKPDSEAIIRLADCFGVSCDYLLGVIDTNLHSYNDIVIELGNIEKRLEAVRRYLTRQ